MAAMHMIAVWCAVLANCWRHEYSSPPVWEGGLCLERDWASWKQTRRTWRAWYSGGKWCIMCMYETTFVQVSSRLHWLLQSVFLYVCKHIKAYMSQSHFVPVMVHVLVHWFSHICMSLWKSAFAHTLSVQTYICVCEFVCVWDNTIVCFPFSIWKRFPPPHFIKIPPRNLYSCTCTHKVLVPFTRCWCECPQ